MPFEDNGDGARILLLKNAQSFSMTRILWVFTLLIGLSPMLAHGQYFHTVQDFDSSADVASAIKYQSDGSLFVFGHANTLYGKACFGTMVLANDTVVVQKNLFNKYINNVFYFDNVVRSLPGDEYVAALGVQMGTTSSASIVKFNSLGDTLFLRTLTDTTTDLEEAHGIGVCSNGDLLIAGDNGPKQTPNKFSAMLQRTDSFGRVIWKRLYRKNSVNSCEITSVQELADGRLLVGATSFVLRNVRGDFFNNAAPWVFITDANGNILKERTFDTVYGVNRAPNVYRDANGGYFMYGAMDSLLKLGDAIHYTNYPRYLAHLDTNLQMTWVKNFADTFRYSSLTVIRQLRNGDYLLVGNKFPYFPHDGSSIYAGWVAKLDRSGRELWNKVYYRDTISNHGLMDAVELPDKSLVLCGSLRDRNGPRWRQYDLWILGLDSNGCEHVRCLPLAIPNPLWKEHSTKVYPNPSTGTVHIACKEEGVYQVLDLNGSLVLNGVLHPPLTNVYFPPTLPAAFYLIRTTNKDGISKMHKLLYQP